MAERKFTREITQAEGHGFDKPGDAYEGTFESIKTVQITDPKEGKRSADLIMLAPDEGPRFGVWANAVLRDLMAEVQPGAYVRITHTGVGPKKGKNSPTKLFKIEVAE